RWAVLRHAYHSPEYNERLDGIVYCAFAALGFAAAENIGYVLTTYEAYPSIVWIRAISAVPVHLMVGITMGYYLSLSKYSTSEAEAARNKRRSLMVPVLLHGTYDFILFLQIPVLLLVLIPFVIYLWVSGIKKLNRFYRESRDTYRRVF
ncbi:MAG: PrsW family glutamic-type intramembrane protease, partial [Eubacteriales bacterium]